MMACHPGPPGPVHERGGPASGRPSPDAPRTRSPPAPAPALTFRAKLDDGAEVPGSAQKSAAGDIWSPPTGKARSRGRTATDRSSSPPQIRRWEAVLLPFVQPALDLAANPPTTIRRGFSAEDSGMGEWLADVEPQPVNDQPRRYWRRPGMAKSTFPYPAESIRPAAMSRFRYFDTTLGLDLMACPIWAAVDGPSCPAMALRNSRSLSEMSDSADSTTTSVFRR